MIASSRQMLSAQSYDKKALSEQVFGNTSCEGGQFGQLPCEVDSDETIDQPKHRQYCCTYYAVVFIGHTTVFAHLSVFPSVCSMPVSNSKKKRVEKPKLV